MSGGLAMSIFKNHSQVHHFADYLNFDLCMFWVRMSVSPFKRLSPRAQQQHRPQACVATQFSKAETSSWVLVQEAAPHLSVARELNSWPVPLKNEVCKSPTRILSLIEPGAYKNLSDVKPSASRTLQPGSPKEMYASHCCITQMWWGGSLMVAL